MSEQKVIGYRIPINPAMLEDAVAFGHVLARAMHGAQIERTNAAEGRATTIDRIAITVVPDEQPFDPKPENLFWITLHMTITIAE